MTFFIAYIQLVFITPGKSCRNASFILFFMKFPEQAFDFQSWFTYDVFDCSKCSHLLRFLHHLWISSTNISRMSSSPPFLAGVSGVPATPPSFTLCFWTSDNLPIAFPIAFKITSRHSWVQTSKLLAKVHQHNNIDTTSPSFWTACFVLLLKAQEHK